MFARNLEQLLGRYSSKADFGREAADAFEKRFRALRRSGLLPRGRAQRSRRLTTQEIAHGVLSIVSVQPDWAGLTATILAKLVPACRATASFCGATTLLEAISTLIEEEAARTKLVQLTISSAEGGVNSNGYASLIYTDSDGRVLCCQFVHRLMTSFQDREGDALTDSFARFAKVSRDTVLSSAFFESLAREVERSQHFDAPAGDGNEYSIEEAEEQRRQKLGVRRGARYMNIGVDVHVAWPKDELLIQFDNYEFVLMPRTEDHAASVHIDLHRYRLSQTQAMTVINRLLSVMSWVDDHFAISQGGWSGNPVPVAVSKRELATVTSHHWMFDRRIPDGEDTRRALALYREARNAQQNFMVSYAVLNFYKIIELRHQGRGPAKNWIRDNFAVVRANYGFDEAFARLEEIRGAQEVHEYLYTACRLAVAHASAKSPSDPDDADEIRRLHTAADVLRWMARHLIKTEMGVGDRPWEADDSVVEE